MHADMSAPQHTTQTTHNTHLSASLHLHTVVQLYTSTRYLEQVLGTSSREFKTQEVGGLCRKQSTLHYALRFVSCSASFASCIRIWGHCFDEQEPSSVAGLTAVAQLSLQWGL
jgi:hypothetical protein